MNTLLMLLFFISTFLVVTGVHEQRIKEAKIERDVVYRYIPRSAMDEQYYGTSASARFRGLFNDDTPWMEKNLKGYDSDASYDTDEDESSRNIDETNIA